MCMFRNNQKAISVPKCRPLTAYKAIASDGDGIHRPGFAQVRLGWAPASQAPMLESPGGWYSFRSRQSAVEYGMGSRTVRVQISGRVVAGSGPAGSGFRSEFIRRYPTAREKFFGRRGGR